MGISLRTTYYFWFKSVFSGHEVTVPFSEFTHYRKFIFIIKMAGDVWIICVVSFSICC